MDCFASPDALAGTCREVLAHPTILNVPDRIDWKSCQLTKDEETTETKSFRAEFRSFDPFVKKK